MTHMTKRWHLPCRQLKFAALLTGVLLLPCTRVQAEEWRFLTHSTGGQVKVVDGNLRGTAHAGKRAFFVELVIELQKRLRLNSAIEEVPLARGKAQLGHSDNVALFNLDMTPERQNLMKWVGPIWHETDYLYERADQPTGINEIEQARNLPTCVLNQNIHDQILTRHSFSNLSRSNSYDSCLKMLLAGRVKLVVLSSFELNKKLDLAGVAHNSVRQLPVIVSNSPGYIALSRTTPDAEVKRWQAALNEIRQSGKYQLLYQEYVE